MENWEYLGWVPCISGHLDFGLMNVGIKGGFTDDTSKDEHYIEENFSSTFHADSHQRKVVLQSRVDWRDSPRYSKESGHFRVLVTAEVNPSECMDERFLEGSILIYPLMAEPDDTAQKMQMNIHELCHDIEEESDLQKRLILFDKLKSISDSSEPVTGLSGFYFCSSIKFRIEPNGLTWLSHNNRATSNEDSQFVVARQAFYYLKYSIHVHKHHTNKQDSLTTIVSLGGGEKKDIANSGLKIICQLKRELTSLNRTQSIDNKPHPTNDACGIIAYVKSLVHSLRDRKIIDDETAARELTRFENVKSSFEVLNKKVEAITQTKEIHSSKAKVWIAFFLAFVFSAFGMIAKMKAPFEIEMPYFYLTPFALLLVLIFFYLYLKQYYYQGTIPEKIEQLYKLDEGKIFGKIAVACLTMLAIIFLF